MAEIDDIRQRYQRRSVQVPPDRYSFTKDDVLLAAQAVDRATMNALLKAGFTDLGVVRLLEIGCGGGGNLLRFLRWGFAPQNLVGNELLEERAQDARRALPAETRILPGDARGLPDDEFDVVYQSTVLSSILDDKFQLQVAERMWELTRQEGIVLSYDFIFGNPCNPDVRRVTPERLRSLFPHGEMSVHRVTLAPPLARRVARSPVLYAFLSAFRCSVRMLSPS
jgi:SAM-dependent methyltransferase